MTKTERGRPLFYGNAVGGVNQILESSIAVNRLTLV
jgi:hypothetical protein